MRLVSLDIEVRIAQTINVPAWRCTHMSSLFITMIITPYLIPPAPHSASLESPLTLTRLDTCTKRQANALGCGCNVQFRERSRLPLNLLPESINVVEVDMCIADDVDEIARLP